MPDGKAPGPHGVPNKVLKHWASLDPHAPLDVFNACLKEAKFPASWKVARLALAYIGGGKPVTTQQLSTFMHD